MKRLFWRWDRLWCFVGRHAFGYSPDHDAVMCFACGKWAPMHTWRDYLKPSARIVVRLCHGGRQ